MTHAEDTVPLAGAVFDFRSVGRLPLPGDNAAIATRDLPRGLTVRCRGAEYELAHAVPEGHRFAIVPVEAGDALLSWNLPFGRALRRIQPGEYLCNASVLDALRLRDADLELPPAANFQNVAADFTLDEAAFRPGRQVDRHAAPDTFPGYPRPGGRGVGTRNVIVVIGTSSGTGAFARQLAARLKPDLERLARVDGIEAVAHTEGGGPERPNNLEFTLRTLAGFMVHPNVAAVLFVDRQGDYLNNDRLRAWLVQHDYPLQHVPHAFYRLDHDLETSLEECGVTVRGWYPAADAAIRRACPLSGLKIALQCGGSDAFSGISGNPLAGRVAREVIRHGGAAGLAETDELIGAEPYMLANTRDIEVARQFLQRIAVFRERIGWHGHSAEGNPSGGNQFRGLYNIALKSIGAARKKDPDVRLDHVIGYGERMTEPGFYFMDSPGNDLESIAGQVASGCNLIFFITGNGSITNFPFVPTIKFITTTRRWNLLSRDMDVNAGRYLDGEPLEALARETFELALHIASGERSAGERAAHSQVSIWRNWRQTDGSRRAGPASRAGPDGHAIAIPAASGARPAALPAGPAGRIGLIMPTSLCAGQIAQKTADRLNQRLRPGSDERPGGLTRFVALPHTEGCGASGGENEEHFLRTAAGHLANPLVGAALLLEHGCEHTHNDRMRQALQQFGLPPDRFGYASIQLDGGIDTVMNKVIGWFAHRQEAARANSREQGARPQPAVGLTAVGPVPDATAVELASVAAGIVAGGGTVVLPHSASLLDHTGFLGAIGLEKRPPDSLAYGQFACEPGLHVMATPTTDFVESLTGLGGTGVSLMGVHVVTAPQPGHPMIPTLQLGTTGTGADACADDLDLLIGAAGRGDADIRDAVLALLRDTLTERHRPRAWGRGFTAFQLTRGLFGVSL